MAHKTKRKSSHTQFTDSTTTKSKGSTVSAGSVTSQNESSSVSYKTPDLPSVGGNAQLVLVLGAGLFALAEWKTVIVPVSSLVWTGKSQTINWKGSLGMAIMLGFMVFLASVSEDAAGLMVVIMLGFWMVYLVENGTGTLSSLFKWLNPAPATKQTAVAPANSNIK